MATKSPKTLRGKQNKLYTGDGRKKPTQEDLYGSPSKKKKSSLW